MKSRHRLDCAICDDSATVPGMEASGGRKRRQQKRQVKKSQSNVVSRYKQFDISKIHDVNLTVSQVAGRLCGGAEASHCRMRR
jgi:hypothetical protein